MDPLTIGASVVTILTPYVADAGKELVKAAGEVGLEKAKGLMNWLKASFANDPVAASDLSRFEKDPTAFAPGLEATIATRAKDDPAFSAEVSQRVKDLAPIVTILVEYEHAKRLVALEADEVRSGQVSVTVRGTTAEDVKAAVIKTIG